MSIFSAVSGGAVEDERYKLVAPHRHGITQFTSFFQGNSLLLPPIRLTMKPFVLLATIVALVNGRPEPPTGYNYPRPGGGHHHHVSSGGGNFIGGGNFLGGNQHFGGVNGGHQISSGSFQTGSSHFQTGSSSFDGGNFNHPNTFNANNIFAGQTGGSIADFGSTGGSFHGHSSGGVTVQKHIYVHVPPPEPEEHHVYRPIPVAQAQKHYKIIFIKAPTQATPTAPTIPLQAQNEEKTLVYVLVKKPEEQPEISIPTAAPTQPSKPEVYFIRYKTKKEGGGVISSGINTIGSGISTGDITSSGITGSGISGISGITSSGISGTSTGIHSGGDILTSTGSHTSINSGTSSVYGPPGHVSGGPY